MKLGKIQKIVNKVKLHVWQTVTGNRYTFVEEVLRQVYYLVNLVYVCLKLTFLFMWDACLVSKPDSIFSSF